MDTGRRLGYILQKTTAVLCLATMLASCSSTAKDAVPQKSSADMIERQIPTTVKDAEVNATAVSADEALWNELQEKARLAAEDRQRKKDAEAAAAEQARLAHEAEIAEQERLEAEHMAEIAREEAEAKAEAERQAEIQRQIELEEEARRRDEELKNALLDIDDEDVENGSKITILDEEKPKDDGKGFRISEDDMDFPSIGNDDVSLSINTDHSGDKIYQGNVDSDIPSWILSPKEQEQRQTDNTVINVNVLPEKDTAIVDDSFSPDDILAIGNYYQSNRQDKKANSNMDGTEAVSKAKALMVKAAPIVIIVVAITFAVLLLRIMIRKIMAPKKKVETEIVDGVEMVSDGIMTARPGAVGAAGNAAVGDSDEDEDPDEDPSSAEAKTTEPRPVKRMATSVVEKPEEPETAIDDSNDDDDDDDDNDGDDSFNTEDIVPF